MKYKNIIFNETDSLLKGYLDIENFKVKNQKNYMMIL